VGATLGTETPDMPQYARALDQNDRAAVVKGILRSWSDNKNVRAIELNKYAAAYPFIIVALIAEGMDNFNEEVPVSGAGVGCSRTDLRPRL
jgi:hypothetical protein